MGLLTSLIQRSLENPSTPLSAPDDWLFDALGSFRASSGVNVNRETALTYDAYWRCINLISGDVAKLPIHVFKRSGTNNEVRTRDDDHAAYRLLRWEADPDISALDFKRTLTFHAMAEGNGYAYIQRGGDGRPLELWPLSPMKTYPIRVDLQIWYITEVGATQRKLRPDDVFHLKGLSFDGLVGYSAVAKMRETLGLGLAAQNFGSIFFRNNARPNVVIRHPGRLKPEAKQNLRESWERIHAGLENAHRTAILEEGMDLKEVMHNARDSQLLELRRFNRIEVCNFFGVPAHKVGDDAKVSYNSLEQENQEYLEDGGGLGFWLAAWESEAWRKLLTVPQQQRRTHTINFDKKKLLRANLQTRTQYYTAMIQCGVLCPDEVRQEEGLNPRADGKGCDFVTPTAPQQAAGAVGSVSKQEEGKKEDDGTDGSEKKLPTPQRLALSAPADCRPPTAADVRKATDPTRTAEEALDLLEKLPDADDEGNVAVLMPVEQNPSYDRTLDNFRDLPTKKIKIRTLVATQPIVKRDLVASYIKDPDYAERTDDAAAGEGRGQPIPGLPNDQPYIVRCEGIDYVHDGHHKLTAWQLLGTARCKVYFWNEDKDKQRSQLAAALERSEQQRECTSAAEDRAAAAAVQVKQVQEQMAQASREILIQTLRRLVRRVSVHAQRAAKDPFRFVAWVDRLETDHQAVFYEALSPPLAAARSALVGHTLAVEPAAAALFEGLRSAYLHAAECKAEDLAKQVDLIAASLEQGLPGEITDKLTQRSNDGSTAH